MSVLTEAAEVAAAAEAKLQAEHDESAAELMADFEAWLDGHHACRDCNGSGLVRVYRSYRLNDYVMGSCHVCRKPGR
jgi:hypothetical protein